MQRMIEATLINKILQKYEQRLKECQDKWDDDYAKIKQSNGEEMPQDLIDDMNLVNVQIGAYECIVKDLKGLVK